MSTVYGAINSGALVARKLGCRTVILEDDELAWIKSLPRFEPRTQAVA